VSPVDLAPGLPEFGSLLESGLSRFGLSLDTGTIQAVAGYLSELERWRARINLTGKLSTADLAEHTLESLLGAALIPDSAKVIDVGSGAGFPGMPIAIARADLHLTLVEPRSKKAAFLRHAARAVRLANVEVLEERSESLPRAGWAVATTRAVAALPSLAGLGNLLEASGLLLAWTVDTGRLSVPGFHFEKSLEIPGSKRKVIAAFRRL
jgi:16S rRNA (guanine527-N7)-methyltransferase